jgi:ubiquinone/menaquinone biosynthesis C-methylase UbiE
MAVEDEVARTQSAYDQIAETYAEVNSGDVPDPLLRLARTLACHVGLGARIIDVGCGAGRDVRWFESQGIQVTGIDLSAAMLAQASDLTGSSLLRMDMRRLAWFDASFDGAWCAASLLHLPKREVQRALQEVWRILKPGGMAMVLVKQVEGEAWGGGYVDGVMRFFAYYQRAEMAAILDSAGFAVRADGEWRSSSQVEGLSFLCVLA